MPSTQQKIKKKNKKFQQMGLAYTFLIERAHAEYKIWLDGMGWVTFKKWQGCGKGRGFG